MGVVVVVVGGGVCCVCEVYVRGWVCLSIFFHIDAI